MKKKVRALLAAVMAVSLTACGAGTETAAPSAENQTVQEASETTASETSATETADNQTENGRGVTIAVASQFTTLDPALNTETVNEYVNYHLYSGLFRFDTNGEPQPELCESYETSDDGLTWTFHLRDAQWSDGTPITAQDFEYSYLRVLSYGAENAYNCYDVVSVIDGAKDYNDRALAAQADGKEFDCTTEDHSGVGIKATDDKTLVLTLMNPCTYLPRMLNSMCWMPVPQSTPQHDSLWSMEAGYPTSGPYTLAEFNQNEKAVLKKNPSYFKADEITMPEVTFLVMTDVDAQTVAFQAGDIDVANDISLDGAGQYIGTENLWLQTGATNYFLAINSGKTGPAWAQDVNLRRAVALAIDKEAVVEILGGAEFYPVINGYIPYGFPDSNGEDFRTNGDNDGYTLTYDPEQAKALLAAAGYDENNPLHIVYKYSTNGIHADVATALQSMWAAVGIEAEFAAVEMGVFYDQLDAGDFELSRYGYSVNTSPVKYMELWTTGMQVVAAVDDPAFDQMIADIKAEPDPAKFLEKCHKAEDYLCEENVYVIPLFQFNSPSLISSDLKGAECNLGELFFGHCHFE